MAVKFLIDLLNAAVRWVEHLPLASIDNVWIYPVEVLAFYLALLACMRHMMVRSAKSLYLVGVCLLVTGSLHWAWRMADRPVQSIVFYNVRGCPVVHCIESQGKSWLAYADSIPDERRLSRAVTGYWNRLHLNTPIPITKTIALPASGCRTTCFCSVINVFVWSVITVGETKLPLNR